MLLKYNLNNTNNLKKVVKMGTNFIQNGETVIDMAPEEMAVDTSALEDLLSSMSGDEGSYINVWEEITGYRDKTFIDCFPSDQFSYSELLKHIQRTYGGGNYRLMVYGKGGIQKGGNKLVRIKSAIGDKSAPASSTGGGDTIALIMREMKEQNATMMAMMRDSMQAQQPKSNMEMLQELQLMKAIMQPDQPQNGGGVGEIIKTIKSLKELELIGVSDDSSDTSMEKLIGIAGSLVQKAVDTPTPSPQPVNRSAQPMTKPQRQPRQNQAHPQPEEQDDMMIRMGIAAILNFIKGGAEPWEPLDLIFQQIPEGKIKEFLLEPDSIDELIKLNAELAQHKPWLLDLAEHIKGALGMPSKFADEYEGHPNKSANDTDDKETASEFTVDDFPSERPLSSDEKRDIIGDHLIIENEGAIVEEPKIAEKPVKDAKQPKAKKAVTRSRRNSKAVV